MSIILGIPEFISGLFSLLYVIASTGNGLLIIRKYSKHKDKTLILVGLAIIGISCPWWSSALSFISILLLQQSLTQYAYLITGNVFVPIFTYCWILATNRLLFGGKNKKFIAIYAIIFIMFEVVFFILLFINPDLIGVLDDNHIDISYHFIVMGLLVLIVITVLITGLMIAHRYEI